MYLEKYWPGSSSAKWASMGPYLLLKRMENGADVESAQSEVCWARIQFNVTRKEEKGEEKRQSSTAQL